MVPVALLAGFEKGISALNKEGPVRAEDSTVHFQSVFSPEYIGHEDNQASRQAGDGKLMDGEDLFQSVDPVLHRAGVEVVIDATSNAPDGPHCIHHQRHGGADRRLRQPLPATERETPFWITFTFPFLSFSGVIRSQHCCIYCSSLIKHVELNIVQPE